MSRAARHFRRSWLRAKAGTHSVWLWTKRTALALKSFFAHLDAVAVFTPFSQLSLGSNGARSKKPIKH